MNYCNEFFEIGVCEKIGYYVYRLLDGDETFYIGKGKGNRAFDHAKQAKNEDRLSFSNKEDRINKALSKGTFNIVIHRHGLSEEQAFLLESALIDMHLSYGYQLTNIQPGHHQGIYGSSSPEQINLSYSTPKTLIKKASVRTPSNTLLISINSSWAKEEQTPEGILRMVQYCWRIKKPSIETTPYVFAVANRIVRGVFKVDRWLKSDDEQWVSLINRNKDELITGRYGFVGAIAKQEIWSKYVNTELPSSVTFGSGQPILYGHRVSFD